MHRLCSRYEPLREAASDGAFGGGPTPRKASRHGAARHPDQPSALGTTQSQVVLRSLLDEILSDIGSLGLDTLAAPLSARSSLSADLLTEASILEESSDPLPPPAAEPVVPVEPVIPVVSVAPPVLDAPAPELPPMEERVVVRGAMTTPLDAQHPSDAFLEGLQNLFGPQTFQRFLDLNLLPLAYEAAPETGEYRLVVAAQDPMRPDVQEFLQGLEMLVELHLAPGADLLRRIQQYRDQDQAPASPEKKSLNWTSLGSVAVGDGQEGAPPDAATLEPAAGEVLDPPPAQEAPTPRSGEKGEKKSGGRAPLSMPPRSRTQGRTAPPDMPDGIVPYSDESALFSRLKDRVVLTLLRKGLVIARQVFEAEELQKRGESKDVLWRALTQISGVSRDAVFEEAARVYAFPAAQTGPGRPDPEFIMLIMETVAESRREELLQMCLLPFEYDIDPQNGSPRLIFITHDPARPEVHRLLQGLKLGRFELQYASETYLKGLIAEVFPRKNEFLERMTEDPMAVDLGTSFQEKNDQLIDEAALEAEINRSSLINLFEATLVEAVRKGASDVHIFPNPRKQIDIHFRVDGKLFRWHTEDKAHPQAFLAIVKDNATNVDRFERDMAQDGFIQRNIDGTLIRFRVSVLPIATANQEIRAESIVIRVLDDRKVLTDLRKLGMLESAMERFNQAIRQPHGMVILTGPTGSGKSTTLVAALHQVVTPEVNVLTVEDPVEYIIQGVRQIKLGHKLDFEQALRAILRHDPDIVMVGEMRDKITAELAIKLANTGHLTFSTLHTNDAPSAISRLYKMGIEPFLIAYAINLVVAQRLIRRLCPDCKQHDPDPDKALLRLMGFTDQEVAQTRFFKASERKTCKTCSGQGYKGRRAVSEALYFSREIRQMIVEMAENLNEDAIRQQAVKEGMLTLQASARELVKMGDTSVEEMLRVTASE
jgi:type IV pilus assembly protein PilB